MTSPYQPASSQPGTPSSARPPHPGIYAILVIPFGAVSGYVSVAIAFLCTRYNLTVQDGAVLVASGVFPHVWKYLWAPIADTTLSRQPGTSSRSRCAALGITAMSAIPLSRENLHLLQVVIFTTNLASTFLGMSVEGLMAHATPEDQRGRVERMVPGGQPWRQRAGRRGGALDGGTCPHPGCRAPVLGLLFVAGALALRSVPEAPAEPRKVSLPRTLVGVVLELWSVLKSRGGLLCAALCVLPINSGGAQNVLSQAEVAEKWGVAEGTVSLVNGVLGGIVSALGCLVAGEICARINSRKVYAAVGLLLAGVAVAMALSPFSGTNYVVFSLAYAFVLGMSYAAFTGFVLDAIGKGAAATKYNAFAGLSNAPIMYMGLVVAWDQTRWGEKVMLYTDAGAGVIGLLALGVVASVLMPRRSAPVMTDAAPAGISGRA